MDLSFSASVFFAATTTNLALRHKVTRKSKNISNLNISQILSNFHKITKQGSSGVVTCLDGARDKKTNIEMFHIFMD